MRFAMRLKMLVLPFVAVAQAQSERQANFDADDVYCLRRQSFFANFRFNFIFFALV